MAGVIDGHTQEMRTDVDNYFASLHSRRHAGKKMEHRKVSIRDWSPVPGQCHANVDFWVNHHPQLKAIRGWMIISEDDLGHCWFEAHSVIEEAGQFYDITLQDQTTCNQIRFLPHIGTPEQFWDIERNYRQTVYPQPALELHGDTGLHEFDDDEKF
jgi:hypothetical protein